MPRRITIIDIAARAGVHFTTVGRALNGDPRVNVETRSKIEKIAVELGYSRDPMLSALSAYRKAQKPTTYHENIAWITSYPTRDGWRMGTFCIFFEGAAKRASELGFRLEEFWIKEPGMTSRRASSVLSSRGIHGLIIAPLPAARGHLSLNWDHFSSVAFDISRPRLPIVITCHFRDMINAVRHLKGLGHRRLGYANSSHIDERTAHQWKAAFWSETQGIPKNQQIPILSEHPFQRERFLAWFERNRPTAILSSDPLKIGGRILTWLREAGYSVPGDVSVALFNILEEDQMHTGIKDNSFQVGEAAVDFLAGLLREGKRGVPEHRSHLFIEGKWVDGATVGRCPAKGQFYPPRRVSAASLPAAHRRPRTVRSSPSRIT